MIRDITIGQYYPAKSVLHRLDPRTKFLGTLGFLISVFLFHTFLGYAVATVFLVAMIAISKVPVKFMFKGRLSSVQQYSAHYGYCLFFRLQQPAAFCTYLRKILSYEPFQVPKPSYPSSPFGYPKETLSYD